MGLFGYLSELDQTLGIVLSAEYLVRLYSLVSAQLALLSSAKSSYFKGLSACLSVRLFYSIDVK